MNEARKGSRRSPEEALPEPMVLRGDLLHFRWDLDKTYLRTEFDTLRDIVRTWRQKADEKTGVPGARTLLQELLKADAEESPRKVTFISGSPRQMRKVLTEKLRLDEIEPVEFILKPNLSNILKLRLKAVRGQVGYKLEALLRTRIYADRVDEILFGDDAEQDAFIYSLYADILEGRISAQELEDILIASHVYRSDAQRIMRLYAALRPVAGGVQRIFIHLDRRSPVRRFRPYGARVVPVFNYFQVALVLFGEGLFSGTSLLNVLHSMGAQGYTPTRIANSVQDMMRRGFLPPDTFARVAEQLGVRGDEPSVTAIDDPRNTVFLKETRRALALSSARPRPSPLWNEEIDYLSLADAVRWHRMEATLRTFSFLE